MVSIEKQTDCNLYHSNKLVNRDRRVGIFRTVGMNESLLKFIREGESKRTV